MNNLEEYKIRNINSLKISINSIAALNSELEKYGFQFLSHELNSESDLYEVKITDIYKTKVLTLEMEHELINKDELIFGRALNYFRPYKR